MEILNVILQWLKDVFITSNAWLYLVSSTIGLYSNVYWTIKKESRKPNKQDLIDLAGQIPLVWFLAIIFDNSPLIALGLGILPDRTFELAQAGFKKGGVVKLMLNAVIDSIKDSNAKGKGENNEGES